jgi:predicted nuclease of predicted toxin-antitoxin system
LRLLVDEDSQARTLVRLLVEAGHDVLTAEVAGLNSLDDAEVFARAIREQRTLVTRNCSDFLALHGEHPEHSGILAIYQDADPSKNMRHAEIVRSIGNVQDSGVNVAGEFLALNAWRW